MTPSVNLFFDLRTRPGAATHSEMTAAAVDMCRWADALPGVDSSVGFSEHHGSTDGYLPSPIVMASAVAGATRRMRISAILLIPFYEPIRLAEDLAVLDLVSEGRVTVVAAAGYVPFEFAMFGVDPKKRGARLEEIVEFLKVAWQGEEFEFEGRRVRVTPRPFRGRRPVLLMGGSSKAAASRAARIADGFWPTANPDLVNLYRAELEKLGIDPGPAPPAPKPMQTLVAVSDDPDSVWDRVADCCAYTMNAYVRWQEEGLGDKVASAYGEPGVNPFWKVTDPEELRSSGRFLVLTPDECVQWARGQGDDITIHPLTGGIDPEIAWKSLQLIQSGVLPHLGGHEDPVRPDGVVESASSASPAHPRW